MQNQIVSFISETAIHYRDSSIVTDAGGSGNLRAGDRMPNPNITLTNGTQQALLASLTRPQHLLIVQQIPDPARLASSLRGITLVELAPRQPPEVTEHLGSEPGMWLVRPDGYLGFRGGQDVEGALVDYARSVGIAVP